jgi:GH24 family phage-related lysozyme (muramidase)
LSEIDKLGLYGDVEGVTVPEADRIEGGSFQLREAIPSQFVPRDVLGFNDAGITQVPEDVSGVMSDQNAAMYNYGLDRVTIPHERYGGADPATIAHEVGGHRGFNVMGRPMHGWREHDVIYGQDPREWARERVLKEYDKDQGKFVQREAWTSDPAEVASGVDFDWTDPARRQREADSAFEEANQMAREYAARLERQRAGMQQEQPGMQGVDYGGLLAEERPPVAAEGLISTAKDALTGVFKPSTKSGVGADVTPTSLRQAQSMDKAYYFQDGEKKLAVTAEQLSRFKKSDRYDSDSKKSALTQWANIAGKEGIKDLIKRPYTPPELAGRTPKVADIKSKADYSSTALDRIAEWEGGYQDKTFSDVGTTRIGFGRAAKKGEKTTEAKERKWLSKKVDEIGSFLDGVVTADLTEDQKAALASLVYNVGRTSFKKSKALAALNAGDMEEFRRQAFSKEQGWVKSGGKFTQGLLNRRKKEEKLFFG